MTNLINLCVSISRIRSLERQYIREIEIGNILLRFLPVTVSQKRYLNFDVCECRTRNWDDCSKLKYSLVIDTHLHIIRHFRALNIHSIDVVHTYIRKVEKRKVKWLRWHYAHIFIILSLAVVELVSSGMLKVW